MQKNRDYFTRPIQSGGRSSSNYGRTRITVDRAPRSDRLWWAFILLIVAYVVVQIARAY